MKYLLLLLLPFTAQAQETLDYTSGPITMVGQGVNASVLGEDITGTMVLANELPANGTTLADPTFFSAGIDGNTLMITDPISPWGGTVSFTTVDGQITAFNVSQLAEWGGPAGDYFWASPATGGELIAGPTWVESATEGSWVDPPGVTAAPEVGLPGAGSSLALALGICAVILGRRRRA